MDAYYPGRVSRLVICNAPIWFYSVWSMVARVLPDSVRKKISIIGGCSGLNEFIDPSQRPLEYEGTGMSLYNSPDHLKFVEIGHQWPTQTNSNTSSSSALTTSSSDGLSLSSQINLPQTTPRSSGIMNWVKSKISTQSTSPSSSSDATNAFLGEKNL